MEELIERKFAHSYYGTVEFCSGRIVINPDWSKPIPFAVNYNAISLPLECYKEMEIKVHKGQYVFVKAYWIDGQWNPEYEVFDAKNIEKKENEQLEKIGRGLK